MNNLSFNIKNLNKFIYLQNYNNYFKQCVFKNYSTTTTQTLLKHSDNDDTHKINLIISKIENQQNNKTTKIINYYKSLLKLLKKKYIITNNQDDIISISPNIPSIVINNQNLEIDDIYSKIIKLDNDNNENGVSNIQGIYYELFTLKYFKQQQDKQDESLKELLINELKISPNHLKSLLKISEIYLNDENNDKFINLPISYMVEVGCSVGTVLEWRLLNKIEIYDFILNFKDSKNKIAKNGIKEYNNNKNKNKGLFKFNQIFKKNKLYTFKESSKLEYLKYSKFLKYPPISLWSNLIRCNGDSDIIEFENGLKINIKSIILEAISKFPNNSDLYFQLSKRLNNNELLIEIPTISTATDSSTTISMNRIDLIVKAITLLLNEENINNNKNERLLNYYENLYQYLKK